MRHPLFLRSLCFALAVVAPVAVSIAGAGSGCGPSQNEIWVCLNPVTGKEDGSIYDANHYVNGVFDPCHCYDPCGPTNECPIVVDAGSPQPGCDGGDGGP